jgi:hypothetical protein
VGKELSILEVLTCIALSIEFAFQSPDSRPTVIGLLEASFYQHCDPKKGTHTIRFMRRTEQTSASRYGEGER